MAEASAIPNDTVQELAPGDILGSYQLVMPVARGGMGMIWAARQIAEFSFRKLVAIKITHGKFASIPEFEKLFLDEARIASSIHHQNVCTIYHLGDEGRRLFLAMEWVNGGTVGQILEALPSKRMDWRIAARIVVKACAGLHAAHELTDEDGTHLGVVHRDVSPQNILISADGHVKVTDFGVAKARGQLHQATETGEIKGKVGYLAPEQLMTKSCDRRADVFALGSVLYEMAVGRSAFGGANALDTMYGITEGIIDRPRQVDPEFPEELEDIILRALSPGVENRFQTADSMRMAIEVWLARTGPIVTEKHIADVVRETIGAAVDARSKTIRETTAMLDAGVLVPSHPEVPAGLAASGERPRVRALVDDLSPTPNPSPAVPVMAFTSRQVQGLDEETSYRRRLYVATAALAFAACLALGVFAGLAVRRVSSAGGTAAAAETPAVASRPAPSR